MKIKILLKSLLGICGILLWLGTLTPEILITQGKGCILDMEGNAIEQKEAEEIVDKLLSRQGENLVYKSAIIEYFNSVINDI